ncbi:MAG: tetratricopeptide repeat protein [Candidatus Eisenbacteria bacterium]|nr:tetratricopeptide repeat protein [Candidatus Eisenbacteria bacterium]
MTLILETSSDKAPLEALRDSCQRDPNSKLFMPLAEQLRRRGCYGEAIDICIRAKAIHPRYVSCRVLLGRCLIELGMREEARRELEDVLTLDRENVFSLRVMAEILRAQGELREAVDYYRALVRINPGDMDAQRRLTELMQLPETSQDRESTPSSLNRHCTEGASALDPPKEESPAVGDPSSLETSLRGSRELLKREIRRSDFSRFAEWVSANWQDHPMPQGGTHLGGQD